MIDQTGPAAAGSDGEAVAVRRERAGGAAPAMIPGPNWSRRYSPTSARLCARPGCGAPAAATLRFQPTERAAWLVDLDATAPRAQGDLCERHARSLVLPRGWELHDDRTRAEPAAPEAPVVARAKKKDRPRRKRDTAAKLPSDPPPRLPFEAQAVTAQPVEAPVAAPAATVAAPVDEPVATVVEEPVARATPPAEPAPEPASEAGEPQARPRQGPETVVGSTPADDLDELLDARSPLLRRAFRNAWPR